MNTTVVSDLMVSMERDAGLSTGVNSLKLTLWNVRGLMFTTKGLENVESKCHLNEFNCHLYNN